MKFLKIEKPFLAIVVDDIFDINLYDKAINELKINESHFISACEIEKEDSEKGRYYLDLEESKIPNILSLIKFASNKSFVKTLIGEFALNIEENNLKVQNPIIIRDYDSYSLPPHTDRHNFIITAVFYLGERNSKEIKRGTTLYWPKTSFVGESDNRYSENNFYSQEVTYKSNRMLAFKVGPISFHGLSQTQIFNNNNFRDILIINYMIEP